MQYYHHEQLEKMKAKGFNWKLDGILQKYFPENDKWGADVCFDKDNNLDFVEINKLSKVTQHGATWTQRATIGKYYDCTWEVYSQFNGKNEDELWVFGYYKNFGDACRRVRLGIEKLKPIKIY